MDCYTLEHLIRDRDAEVLDIARTAALLREGEVHRPPTDGLGLRVARRGRALVTRWLKPMLTKAHPRWDLTTMSGGRREK